MQAVLIQAIGFAGTILFFFSFQFKENKTLFRIQFVSYLLYTTHLLLLGAVTGGVSYVINTIRSFCLSGDNEFLKSRYMCMILCGLQCLALFLTFGGWISLLPVLGNIASTLAGYSHDAKKIRLAGMLVNSPMWIVYSVIVGSYAGILDEIVTEASILISIIRFGLMGPDEKENSSDA